MEEMILLLNLFVFIRLKYARSQLNGVVMCRCTMYPSAGNRRIYPVII